MANQFPQNGDANLARQHALACYMLLGTVIATVVNILFLLTQSDIFVPFCSAFSYYLVFLGYTFDGYLVSTYTATGMALAFVGLAVLLIVWWNAKRKLGWLVAGMVLLGLDTLVLAIVAFLFLENPASVIFEGILHIAVIYEMYVGFRSGQQLQRQVAQISVSLPCDEETPAESQYTSDLDE